MALRSTCWGPGDGYRWVTRIRRDWRGDDWVAWGGDALLCDSEGALPELPNEEM